MARAQTVLNVERSAQSALAPLGFSVKEVKTSAAGRGTDGMGAGMWAAERLCLPDNKASVQRAKASWLLRYQRQLTWL